MKVAVLMEVRFTRAEDGSVWTQVGSYRLLARYLDVFDEVLVVARLARGTPAGVRVDGPGVRFADIPTYHGLADYLLKRHRVKRAVRAALGDDCAVIYRLPSVLAEHLYKPFEAAKRPYGAEVVGDPWEVFAKGVIDHPARRLLQWQLTSLQKRLCASACGAAYVTEYTLQRRYPTSGFEMAVSDVELGPLSTHYSSVEIAQADLVDRPKCGRHGPVFRIITVGSMAQPYKGIDTLIKAVAAISRGSRRCELVVLGDGQYREGLERLAVELAAPVRFLGNCDREVVREQLDAADLFAIGSRTEGLPRALIEAMARGLPAVATTVGGIPEVLDRDVLCSPDDVDAFVRVIRRILDNPDFAHDQSAANLRRAADFRAEILRGRRREFFEHVKKRTQLWMARGAGGQRMTGLRFPGVSVE